MPRLNERGVITQVLVLLLLAAGLIGGLYLVQHPQFFKPKAANTGTRIEFSGPGVSADGTSTTSQAVYVNAYYVAPTATPAPTSIPPSNTYNTPSYDTPPYAPPTGIGSTAPIGVGGSVQGVGTSAPSSTTYPDSIKLSNSQAGLTQPCPVVNGVNITCQTSYVGTPTVFAGWKLSDGAGQKTVYAQFLVNNQPLGSPVSANITYNPSTPSPTPSSSPGAARVFVTSTTYNGNLGGLAGADAKCQERANAANLGGTWKAWLSDGTTSAASRLMHSSGPYKLVNGTVVANNWDDLVDGTLQNPIGVTELGTQTVGWNVWTYTNANGTSQSPQNSYNCHNWTTSGTALNNDLGIVGNNGYTNNGWTQTLLNPPCNGYYQVSSPNIHLYCFEQTSSIPSPSSLPSPTSLPISTVSTIIDLTAPSGSYTRSALGTITIVYDKNAPPAKQLLVSGNLRNLTPGRKYIVVLCDSTCSNSLQNNTRFLANAAGSATFNNLPFNAGVNVTGYNIVKAGIVEDSGYNPAGCWKLASPCLGANYSVPTIVTSTLTAPLKSPTLTAKGSINVSLRDITSSGANLIVRATFSGLKPNTTYRAYLCQKVGSCNGSGQTVFKTDGAGAGKIVSALMGLNRGDSLANYKLTEVGEDPSGPGKCDTLSPCLQGDIVPAE